MGVRALSSTSVDLPISGVWALVVAVTDSDGCPADVVPTIVVTLPGGSTTSPVAEEISTGVYRAEYVVGTAGRYVARVTTAAHGAVDFAAHVTATVAGTAMPDLDEVKTYLRIPLADVDQDDEITAALAAESSAQRDVCRVPAAYPASLREALLRRCARNLALRGLPLAVLRGDAEGGDTILPGRDPEVRRLEGPWRKLRMG
ncbi:hypothetical protein [Actinoplanes sp. NPDC049802]|uniref:hypothetical protein n=1 Tax=Actinoplanes sp. NPDC049802 TaxID=3154742 RepID=UPI0033F7F34B